MTEASESTVVRNADSNRYEIRYAGAPAGFAAYTERGKETVFTHTEIDTAFAGKGLGSILASAAIRDTIDRGRTIRPECPFIRSYLDKHPEYAAHVRAVDDE